MVSVFAFDKLTILYNEDMFVRWVGGEVKQTSNTR